MTSGAMGIPTRLETLDEWLRASKQARASGLKLCLERIDADEPSIHAWVQVHPQRPTGEGKLSGIPFGAKDIMETRGLATEYGSPVYKGRIGEADAAIVRELRGRGAILLGKTQTAAFAMRDPAPTRNPRNVNHSPGGSSSGSAAAVAAGMVPFAIGTQTAGSVLRPASYCGVTGFKASFGLFPLEGVLPCARSLDTLGFFTHTPADMLLLWEALGRPAAADEEFVLGIPGAMPESEPEMTAAIQRALRSLRKAGIPFRQIDISAMLVGLNDAHRTIMYFESSRFHRQRVEEYGDQLGYVAEAVRDGLQISEAEYNHAIEYVGKCKARIGEVLTAASVIVTPAAVGPAPLGLTSTGDPRMNSPWSALGTPAISIPMPVSDGLPLGLQLTTAFGQDARLPRAAVRIHQIVNAD